MKSMLLWDFAPCQPLWKWSEIHSIFKQRLVFVKEASLKSLRKECVCIKGT